MYRSMMQVFVKGSETALPFYQKAFDAKLLCRYPENGGSFWASREKPSICIEVDTLVYIYTFILLFAISAPHEKFGHCIHDLL